MFAPTAPPPRAVWCGREDYRGWVCVLPLLHHLKTHDFRDVLHVPLRQGGTAPYGQPRSND